MLTRARLTFFGKGSSFTQGNEKFTAPKAMNTIGKNKGKRRSAKGSQAISAMTSPASVSTRI